MTTDELIISIHALRVEGDASSITSGEVYRKISIHALRVEGDVGLYTGAA